MSESNGEQVLEKALKEIDATGEMIKAGLESTYSLQEGEDDIVLILDQQGGEFTYSVCSTKVRDNEEGFEVVINREIAHGNLKDFLKSYQDVLLAALGKEEE